MISKSICAIVACSVLLAASLGASPRARAAERLEAGVVLTRPDGATVTLDQPYMLLDASEVRGISVVVRDLEACMAAFDDCEKAKDPPAQARKFWSSRAGAGLAAAGVVVVFVGGVVIGAAVAR